MNRKLNIILFVIVGLLSLGSVVFSIVKTQSNSELNFGGNTFPTTLNNWTSGQTISSAWANALEAKVGADSSAVASSLDYRVTILQTRFPTSTIPLMASYFVATSSTGSYFPVLLGVIDASGAASFSLPTNTNPIVDANGEIGVNSTAASSSLRFYDGAAEKALYPEQQRTITVASTSLWNITATTTIPLGVAPRGETWTRSICYTDTGTAGIQFGNYTSSSTYQVLSTALNNAVQTNSFSLYQKRYVDIGTLASSPNYITCTVYYYQNAD